jgi:hypothetical protein
MPASDDRVQLRNPDRTKKGPRIDRGTYAILRKLALATLPAREPGMTLADFRERLAKRLVHTKGYDHEAKSAAWYSMAIKLDLEARGEIKRVGAAPQRLIRG